jgi:hypothetical protein
MKEMLKRRHLASMYGGKTPLAPEPRDMMVIDTVPDIFVTGHVHGAGLSHYKGVRLINASTWQSQTSFQKMHNFTPDPAKLVPGAPGDRRDGHAELHVLRTVRSSFPSRNEDAKINGRRKKMEGRVAFFLPEV